MCHRLDHTDSRCPRLSRHFPPTASVLKFGLVLAFVEVVWIFLLSCLTCGVQGGASVGTCRRPLAARQHNGGMLSMQFDRTPGVDGPPRLKVSRAPGNWAGLAEFGLLDAASTRLARPAGIPAGLAAAEKKKREVGYYGGV